VYAFCRLLGRIVSPLALATVRLARRPERVVLVGLGVAAGAAALALVLAGGVVARDLSLQRSVQRLPEDQRSVRAVWGGIPVQLGTRWSALDRPARSALRSLGLGEPVAAMLYRDSEIGGSLVTLGGIENLGRWVRLTSGRLPRACTAARCEVLQLGGHGRIPSVAGLRLVRVGRAVLTSALPIENFISRDVKGSILSEAHRYHTPATPPFLLAEGVRGVAAAPALADIYRGFDWTVPLVDGSLRPWTTKRFAQDIVRLRSGFEAGSELFDLLAPVEELEAADASSRVAERRLRLIGGLAAALLLAFTVLAAATLRRDAEASWRRLTWAGATRWQLSLAAAAEWGAAAALGTVAGWAAGAGIAALVAAQAGSPSGPVLAHSLLSGWGLGTAAALAVVEAVVLLVALRARPLRALVDAAAAGAVVAIVLALVRGGTDPDELAREGGTGVVLIVLPALIAFAAAVVCARVLAPALRALGRAGTRGPVALRLASLSLARNPGRASVAVGCLVVSLGLALFASTYRSTLHRGQADQAAFAVPRAALLSEDLSKLVPVTDVPWRQLPGATPVLRLDGAVPRLTGSSGFTLLGIPAGEVSGLDGWRGDFSSVPLAQLAARIAPSSPQSLRGVPLRGNELVLPLHVRGDGLKIRAHLWTRRGSVDHVFLGRVSAGATVLRARVPRGLLLFSLSLSLADTELHDVANGGLGPQRRARGTLVLPPRLRDWIGVNGARAIGARRVHYLVTSELDTYVRARQATDGVPVPVITTPRIAATVEPGGVLPVEITGQQLLTRVVGTAARFPSVHGDFLLADRATVASALNAGYPGAGVTSEIWSDGVGADVLARPPFASLAVQTRAAYAADLESEPLARGALIALGAAALVALALALGGLLLGVVAAVRDEGAELLDLEAQGAAPVQLRRHLRLRALVIAAFGVMGGVATGTVMSALVVDLVALTANATSPDPPLLLTLDWRVLGLGLAAYLLMAVALVWLATARLHVLRARPLAETSA
jgi:hypothetical protein